MIKFNFWSVSAHYQSVFVHFWSVLFSFVNFWSVQFTFVQFCSFLISSVHFWSVQFIFGQFSSFLVSFVNFWSVPFIFEQFSSSLVSSVYFFLSFLFIFGQYLLTIHQFFKVVTSSTEQMQTNSTKKPSQLKWKIMNVIIMLVKNYHSNLLCQIDCDIIIICVHPSRTIHTYVH